MIFVYDFYHLLSDSKWRAWPTGHTFYGTYIADGDEKLPSDDRIEIYGVWAGRMNRSPDEG